MAVKLTWLGHGGWKIETRSTTLLLDPFVANSPTAPCSINDLEADVILVSHGHFDHIADVPEIAKRCNSLVITVYEIAEWLTKQHQIENVLGMNIGGGSVQPWGHVKMVRADHSSQLPDGSYGGNPAGFILTIEKKRMYFACDTAPFSDMKLYAEPHLDLAVLPIGDLYTMGPNDAVQVTQWLNPKFVAPAHYNTWPPIAQDAKAWSKAVSETTGSKPIVLEPGAVFEL